VAGFAGQWKEFQVNKKAKWFSLASVIASGAMLFQGGCLNWNGFWNGLWNAGWPTENRWLNIAIDILKEEIVH
jgi:hypothetical protein